MINIVLTDSESVFDTEVKPDSLVLDAGRFNVRVYTAGTQQELIERTRDAEIVLCNRARIGAAEMDAAPQLRMIAVFATGYDKIDIAAARERGIAVCNVPGYSTEAVAQHTLSLMLALVDRITEAASTPIGESALSRLPLPRFCLGGKILGIIGLGAIGRRVARLASTFGMRVYAAEHLGTVGGAVKALTPPVGTAEPGGGISRLPLPQLLAESDIVSLHCPTEVRENIEAFLRGERRNRVD